MARMMTVQKRVEAGARLLTELYGTRRVWGIGPKAMQKEYTPDDAVFARMGINYTLLTRDVNAAGIKGVKRIGDSPTSEVNGAPLGFYPEGGVGLSYDDERQALKDAWIAKFREMRAESIGSTTRVRLSASDEVRENFLGSGSLAPVSSTRELFMSGCR